MPKVTLPKPINLNDITLLLRKHLPMAYITPRIDKNMITIKGDTSGRVILKTSRKRPNEIKVDWRGSVGMSLLWLLCFPLALIKTKKLNRFSTQVANLVGNSFA